MCDDVELCNCCVREFLILTHTWFAFDLPSKTGCDSSAACFDHGQKRLRCAQQPPARKSPDLDDLMSEDLPERDPLLSVDLPDHNLATEQSCTQGKGAVARLALGEVVWLGHGTTLPSLTNKGFQPWRVHHIHPVLGHHDYQLVAVVPWPGKKVRQLQLGMATCKLSADSVSRHPYPRLISDIRTRTHYPLWITNSIHIRYPRVTDIRGYIHLPTTHTTYLNPTNSNMISYLSSKFKYDKNMQPYRICPANKI
jgi:hypothetical protein